MNSPSTIHSPEIFKAELPAAFDGPFHWEFLIPAFKEATGRNIQPMDIDCHVEIGGNHLVIETKKPGVNVPQGQRQALLQLWAKGYHTVIFLWGKAQPMQAEIYYPGGRLRKIAPRKEGPLEITKQELYDVVYRWAKWADKNKCPFQYIGDI